MEASKCSTDSKAAEAGLCDRSINHPFGAKAVEEALCDFVGAIVLRDFFSEYEDFVVCFQLFGQSFIEGVSNSDLCSSFTSIASY